MTRNHLSAFRWRAHYPLVIGALKSRVIIHKVKEKTARGVGKWRFLEEASASLPGEPPPALLPDVSTAAWCGECSLHFTYVLSGETKHTLHCEKREEKPGSLRLCLTILLAEFSCPCCIGSNSSAASALLNQMRF